MIDDYPRIRRDLTCPFCLGDKHDDHLACWPCWRKLKDEPSLEADRVIAELEGQLSLQPWLKHLWLERGGCSE